MVASPRALTLRAALAAVLAALLPACAADCQAPDPDYVAWIGRWDGGGARLGGVSPCPVEVTLATDGAAGGLGGADPHCDRVFLQVDTDSTGGACGVPVDPSRYYWTGEPRLTATTWSVGIDAGTLTLTRDGDTLTGVIPGVLEFTVDRVAVP